MQRCKTNGDNGKGASEGGNPPAPSWGHKVATAVQAVADSRDRPPPGREFARRSLAEALDNEAATPPCQQNPEGYISGFGLVVAGAIVQVVELRDATTAARANALANLAAQVGALTFGGAAHGKAVARAVDRLVRNAGADPDPCGRRFAHEGVARAFDALDHAVHEPTSDIGRIFAHLEAAGEALYLATEEAYPSHPLKGRIDSALDAVRGMVREIVDPTDETTINRTNGRSKDKPARTQTWGEQIAEAVDGLVSLADAMPPIRWRARDDLAALLNSILAAIDPDYPNFVGRAGFVDDGRGFRPADPHTAALMREAGGASDGNPTKPSAVEEFPF